MNKPKSANFKDLYFPRPGLAHEYLNVFEESDSRAITIFGPRGIGKTAFLQNDLMPLASKSGRVPVYIDLWNSQKDPGTAIANRLQDETQRIWGAVKGKRELKGADFEIAGFKLGFDMQRPTVQDREGALHRISLWMTHLAEAGGKKKIMLLLDEVQTLARSEGGVEIAASLRAGMQTNFGHYEAVFTGSSRDHLAAMFRDLRAPLWSYGAEQLFPALGIEFTDSVCNRYDQVTGRILNRDLVWEAFRAVGNNPQALITWVRNLALDSREGISPQDIQRLEAAHVVKDRESKFHSLTPLERAVLIVVGNKLGPFSADAMRYYAAVTDAAVSKSTAQRTVDRLRAYNVLYQSADSRYEIESPVLAEWIEAGQPQALGFIIPLESSPPFESAIPAGHYTGIIKAIDAERILQDVGEGRIVGHSRAAMRSGDEPLLRSGRIVSITYAGRLWGATDPNNQKPGKGRSRRR